MNDRFFLSRSKQYDFEKCDIVFDNKYQIVIAPVLPSERERLVFNVGETGVVIKENSFIKSDDRCSFRHPANKDLCYIARGFSFEKSKNVIRNFFACGSCGIVDMLNPHCYYHWVANDFPRILLCYQAGFRDIVLCDKEGFDMRNLNSFQKDFIECLPNINLISFDDIDGRVIKNICLPVLPDEYGGEEQNIDGVHIYDHYTHRITKYVIREIPQLFDLKDGRSQLRLKIRRRNEGVRESKNSKEFDEYLQKKWGFDVIYLEDHSVAKQMQMMRDSEIVIGAHGSGLVNFIASNNESILIEYGDVIYYENAPLYGGKNRTKTKNFFHFMCEVKGNKYKYIPFSDGYLDIGVVDKILGELLPYKE
jgi:hypothetical protein